MNNFLKERSVRFYPNWNENSIYQMTGLINMIEYIFDQNINANTWAEIGCMFGESTSIMMGFSKIKSLYAIDSWGTFDNYFKEFNPTTKENQVKNYSVNFAFAKDIFFTRLKKEIENKRCIPIINTSSIAVNNFSNNFFDVIYIDADHSYDAVKNDIVSWFPKLKSGGFLCGHDYAQDGRLKFNGPKNGNPWPGVTKAVDEIQKLYLLDSPIIFDDSSFLFQKK